MEAFINVILRAGQSALDVALYTLLPIMVIMMVILKLLDVYGILGWTVRCLGPFTKPLGLTGLGALALLQGSLISFIAPLPTMTLMERQGVADRFLAATLAAVLALAPANATFPLVSMGLDVELTLILSLIGGVLAAASCYWLFGRTLSSASPPPLDVGAAPSSRSLMDIINVSGGAAVQSIINIIPMLLVSLTVVFALEATGVVDAIIHGLSPILGSLGIPDGYVLLTVTKYLAGNSAMVALIHEQSAQPGFDIRLIQQGAGFLINALDLPGLAILTAGGPRLRSVMGPAILAALVGIAFRTIATIWLG